MNSCESKPSETVANDDRAAHGGQSPAFQLPPALAVCEDVTQLLTEADAVATGPLADDPDTTRLLDAVTRILHRRQGNHVLLCGERGVGKTTVFMELARRAAAGAVPFLTDCRFIRIDCRYFPADESRQRLVALFSCIAHRADLVVGLEGFAALLGGDRAANKAVFFSCLTRARCRLIAFVTPHEYETLIADEPAFAEHCMRIDVAEPNLAQAQRLLQHYAQGLEQKFAVTIEAEAVRAAVQLSAQYIFADQLPAKALKILHQACEDVDYERRQQGGTADHITAAAVLDIVAQISGVPAETLRGVAERSDYEQSLQAAVVGQEHAVREVAAELGLIKAGMSDPGKPASVLMFVGQTGTGKTELAKALARLYSQSRRLRTYTLGNCVEPHSVATIIGVPPGYVGNDQGGRIVNELNADPYGVFLLDEADKAHPDVLQPFLNLFDEGWVRDQRGVKAYAHKSIFILTTNVGQRMIADLVQQGRPLAEIADRLKEALAQIKHSKSNRPVFTPEFLARIKRIIFFHPLDRAALAGIVRIQTDQLQRTWREQRGKQLTVPAGLLAALADHAQELNTKSKGREGGRIVRKLLADWIETALQRAITAQPGDYHGCATVAVDFAPGADRATRPPALQVSFAPPPATTEAAAA